MMATPAPSGIDVEPIVNAMESLISVQKGPMVKQVYVMAQVAANLLRIPQNLLPSYKSPRGAPVTLQEAI